MRVVCHVGFGAVELQFYFLQQLSFDAVSKSVLLMGPRTWWSSGRYSVESRQG